MMHRREQKENVIFNSYLVTFASSGSTFGWYPHFSNNLHQYHPHVRLNGGRYYY